MSEPKRSQWRYRNEMDKFFVDKLPEYPVPNVALPIQTLKRFNDSYTDLGEFVAELCGVSIETLCLLDMVKFLDKYDALAEENKKLRATNEQLKERANQRYITHQVNELREENKKLREIANSPEKFDLKEHLDLQRRHAALNARLDRYKGMLRETNRLLEGLSTGREIGTDCNTAGENAKRYAHQIQTEIRAFLAEYEKGIVEVSTGVRDEL